MLAVWGYNPCMASTSSTYALNLAGQRVRLEHRDGKEYLVAPMSMINPGVLNGSKGPLYYPQEEVDKNPRKWNGVPIVVYHPHEMGQPVSAKTPGVLERQGIGTVRNTKSDGKLRAEGWFDVERTKRVNPDIYRRLLRSEPIELSTGLYTENEDEVGSYKGRPYVAVARNYQPDHLAILPDQKGACSIQDGCGVLVNQSQGTKPMKLQDKLRALLNNEQPSEEVSAEKACQILEDGTAQGQPLTDDQKKLFGAACGKSQERNCSTRVHNEDTDDLEGSRQVELDSNRPEDILQSADEPEEAAEDWDLIDGDAESEFDEDEADASTIYGKKYQEHLEDSEEENKETYVGNAEAWTELAHAKSKAVTGSGEGKSWVITSNAAHRSGSNCSTKQDHVKAAALHVKASKRHLQRASQSESQVVANQHTHAARLHAHAAKEHRKMITNEWSDEARKAAAEARKRKSGGGSNQPTGHVNPGLRALEDEDSKLEWPEETTDESQAGLPRKKKSVSRRVTGAGFGPMGTPARGSTNNQKGGPMMARDVKLNAEERKTVINSLINNVCCWEESDREVLNGLNDVTLAKMYRQAELIKNEDVPDELKEDDDEDVKSKEEATKEGDSQADGDEKPFGETNPKPTENRYRLTDQDRKDLAFARRYRMEQRGRHIKTITANESNRFTAKQLQAMDDQVLANMAELAKGTVENQEESFLPSYFGAQGAASLITANTQDEEPLRLGKMDYSQK